MEELQTPYNKAARFGIARLNPRRALFSLGFAIPFTCAMVWGRILSRTGRLDNPILTPADFAIGLAFLACSALAIYAFLAFIDNRDGRRTKALSPGRISSLVESTILGPKEATRTPSKEEVGARRKAFNRKRFSLSWLAVFLIWIPVFLAYYPIIWAYDVYDQVPLETGTQFYANHPLLHTLFIQGGISLGRLLSGGSELGMVMLSIAQMAAMSAIFSYSAEKTRELGAPPALAWCLLAFFGLMPFNPILALSQTKDVLFSGCFLALFLSHWEIMRQERTPLRKIAVTCLLTVFAAMLRNNMVYALAAWVALSAALPGRKGRLPLTIATAACIAASVILTGALCVGLDAKRGQPEEAYSVPIQCLTRIAALNSEYVPEYASGETMFGGLVLRDEFPEDFSSIYQLSNADPAKGVWKRSDEMRGEFSGTALIAEWLLLSAKHPTDSMVAWSLLTKGAWYPLDKSHAHVYDYRANLERQGYLLTDYKVFEGMSEPRPASKLPTLESALELIATGNVHQRSKIASLPFAPATYLWILLMALLVQLYRRENPFPFALILLYFGTVLLGPLIIVRYMYPIMLIGMAALVLCFGEPCANRPTAQHTASHQHRLP